MDDRAKFKTEGKPTWCPGCGNYGIQAALKKALLALDLEPHRVLLSSGIGCAGKMPHWVRVNGFHGLHGRALPAASGMKLAAHDLVVIAEGGDGDGYCEGMGHFVHACRRNQNLTYIVHDNGVFGLTTGQASPTGDRGFVSPATPFGAIEGPLRPLALALAAGATFVARGYSGDVEHLAGLLRQGIRHRGFAFIDVLQVCVSFNPSKSYAWYRERVAKLEESGHDAADLRGALAAALREEDRIPIGVFYRAERPTAEDQLPALAKGPLAGHDVSNVDVSAWMEEFV